MTDEQFINLCADGRLDEAKKLYKININVIRAFSSSCKKGHLNIAQWLYSLGGVNIHDNDDDCFVWSCINGYINVAQWLYSLGDVDIHVDNDEAFRWSCRKGYLDIAQWIYSLGDVTIYGRVCAFVWSCWNDKLNIAQWLYSLGNVNIHVDNDSAFIWSCKNDNIKIVEWLLFIDKFNENIVDAYLPLQLHMYAFNLGYLPINKMKPAYVQYIQYKSKIMEQVKENIFEIDDLVNIIVAYA